MQKNITPLPWITVPHRSDNGQMRAIVEQAPGGYGIAITGWGSVTQKPDDAAFIVKACNSHDELVAALAFYANASNWDEFRADESAAAFDRNTGSTLGDDCGKTARALLAKLEAK